MKNIKDITPVPLPATIIGLQKLSADTSLFRIALDDPLQARKFDFTPGQFVQLSAPAGGEAPISLATAPSELGIIELCIRRIGHVTAIAHSLRLGAKVGIRGPYGNGFPVTKWRGRNILLIAGGLGIAPLRGLLHFLLGRRADYGDITLMYGAREPAAILFKEELAEMSGRRDMHLFLTVDFVTEEPPAGLICNTGVLPSLLRGVNFTTVNSIAAICGPPAVYRCITEELQGFGFSSHAIYVSLERRMKCGVGICCHCAVGDLFCCTDGPVFLSSDLQLIRGGDMTRPTIAMAGLTACSGCQLTLFNCEAELPELTEQFRIIYFPMGLSEPSIADTIDVAFVEGAVSTPDDLEILIKLRSRSRLLVAFGTCALWGGVAAMKNNEPRGRLVTAVYGEERKTLKSFNPQPFHRFIQIDFAITGCPPEKPELLLTLSALLNNTLPEFPRHPVCTECRNRENRCLLIEDNEMCLGPLIQAGCNARCPTVGIKCEGCRGPAVEANVAAEMELLLQKGFAREEVERRMRRFYPEWDYEQRH